MLLSRFFVFSFCFLALCFAVFCLSDCSEKQLFLFFVRLILKNYFSIFFCCFVPKKKKENFLCFFKTLFLNDLLLCFERCPTVVWFLTFWFWLFCFCFVGGFFSFLFFSLFCSCFVLFAVFLPLGLFREAVFFVFLCIWYGKKFFDFFCCFVLRTKKKKFFRWFFFFQNFVFKWVVAVFWMLSNCCLVLTFWFWLFSFCFVRFWGGFFVSLCFVRCFCLSVCLRSNCLLFYVFCFEKKVFRFFCFLSLGTKKEK